MRPLRLTLDGFRSYATATTFEFAERSLVGVVGPIGAGKSSLLDGISFALYGKTHTQAAATKTLIHQRRDAGKVELVFESARETWQVVRVLRRVGESQHAAYRYGRFEDVDSDAKPLERVLKKGPVDERLEEVLGLDFGAFGRSVMLAQNRFAEFLRAKPADRDTVLKGVFGFERIDLMYAEARRRKEGLTRDLEAIDRQLKDMENERQLLAEADHHRQLADERFTALSAIVDDVTEAIEAKKTADGEAVSRRQHLETLESLAARLPSTDETATLLEAAEQAERRMTRASADLAVAREAEATVRTTRDDELAAIGGQAALTEARAVATKLAEATEAARLERGRADQARTDAAKAGEAVAAADSALAAARAELDTATAATEAAVALFEAATIALREAESADAAAAIRRGLADGDECPVCRQIISTVPTVASPEIDVARRAYDDSHVAVDRMRRDQTKLEVEAARFESALTAAQDRELRARERLAAAQESAEERQQTAVLHREHLGSLLGGVGLAEIEQGLSELDEAARKAAAELAGARAAHDEAVRLVAANTDRLEEVAAQLQSLGGALDLEVVVGRRSDEIRMALDKTREAWTAARAEAQELVAAAVAQIERCESRRQDLLAAVDLPVDADFTQALSDAKAALAARTTEVQTRAERLADAERLASQSAATLAERDTYTQLASDLTPSNFLRFLLEEERRTLSRLGSVRFEELSGGRYRFSEDGAFAVVDLTAAEQPRKADTLSGGETFLASLALALALAETVGRGGGRLDAFFLDEGFGSLDAEHLDLAMAGIERLVAGHENRLVVVVSHVPDMKERIEDLIELDKDPATGATLVRRA